MKQDIEDKVADFECEKEVVQHSFRGKINLSAAMRARRREHTELLNKFVMKQNVVEKTCRTVDYQELKDRRATEAKEKVKATKEKWAIRKAECTNKNQSEKTRVQQQLWFTKQQWAYVRGLVQQGLEIQLQDKKKRITTEKEFKHLLARVRDELARHEQGVVSAGDVAEYERTLESFRELAASVREHAQRMAAQVPATPTAADISGANTPTGASGGSPAPSSSPDREDELLANALFPTEPMVAALFPLFQPMPDDPDELVGDLHWSEVQGSSQDDQLRTTDSKMSRASHIGSQALADLRSEQQRSTAPIPPPPQPAARPPPSLLPSVTGWTRRGMADTAPLPVRPPAQPPAPRGSTARPVLHRTHEPPLSARRRVRTTDPGRHRGVLHGLAISAR